MEVIEVARRLTDTESVCDTCLGRQFATLSHGLSNSDRGRSVRIVTSMVDDEPFDPIDPSTCWVCEGYCEYVGAIADRIVESLDGIEFETYQIGCRIPPLIEENDRLFREDTTLEPDDVESVGREINREVGKLVGEMTETTVSFDRPDVLVVVDLGSFDPLEDEDVSDHALDVQINSAFIYGRYRKLDRSTPQTEWPCRACDGEGTVLVADGAIDCTECEGTGYRYPRSVEEVVRPHVVEAMEGENGVFHGAGREDVDARMLGTGRPFVLEVERPKRRVIDTEALEQSINESAPDIVTVSGVRHATYDMVERVKSHPASKRYEATVAFDEPVDEKDFDAALEAIVGQTIEQETPTRVSHRRSDRLRRRTVYDLGGQLHSPTNATVEIDAEGGLYIKELVHGDDGRTVPSLAAELDTAATVTELDVIEVKGEDEPFEREEFFRD